MMKLFHSLTMLIAVAALGTLAGCELYFGGHGDGHSDSWSYCGSDGQYQCQGDNCTWVSPTCTGTSGGSGSTGSGGSGGSGYECTQNTDCAAGCYCSGGTCTEGGFCSTDADCGPGYHCDTQRSSCEPNPPATTCDYDNQCPSGQYCAADHTCTATCTCANDQDAINQGFGWCDETRNTCLPGQDPAGSCGGQITCTTAMPACPSGQVAKSIDGCWTGGCVDFASCDVTPGCTRITDETNCTGQPTCLPVYNGLNCTKSDGTACHSGDVGCVCQSFVFASCTDRMSTSGRLVVDFNGRQIDASQLILH